MPTAETASAPAIRLSSLTTSTIVSSTFSSNEAEKGAAVLVSSGSVEADACRFQDNESGSSGAVSVSGDGVYASEDVIYDDNQDHDIEVVGDTCSVFGDDEVFECREIEGDGTCTPADACG